jgi:hypothetical protein
MAERPDPFPGSRMASTATKSSDRRTRPVAAPLPRKKHVLEPLTSRSMRVIAELRERGIELQTLERRFPHVLNRLSVDWDTPKAALEALGVLLSDRRGGRQGFPEDAIAELAALRRCCVERNVDVGGEGR